MIGDKFSSRSDKGDRRWLAHDMRPTVPDRTRAPLDDCWMLLESILSKACCYTAQIGNATPFDGTNFEDIADKLAACGRTVMAMK
jgi:hypothetical protein